MNIDYKKTGDYLLPNLVIENQNYGEINKYGYLRLNYIKEHKKGLYQALLFIGFDLFERWNKKRKIYPKNKVTYCIGVVLTFHFVCFGFLIFSGILDKV